LKATHQAVEVPRHVVRELLTEIRDPLTSGTLDAPGVVLSNTMDHKAAGKHKAELYCE
jgi:hypothetical protein